MEKFLSSCSALVGAGLGMMGLANPDSLLTAFLVVMFLDYCTGIMSAIAEQSISSRVGIKGILKKFGMLGIVSLCYIADTHIMHTAMLRNACIMYMLANEAISILENVSRMGIPLPRKLWKYFQEIDQSFLEEEDNNE